MEAKELMIGDWIKCDSDFEQVDYLEGNNINGHPENWYEPIPLTAEILEKNGWNDWCEHSTIARSVSVLVEDNTSLCIQEIKGQDSMFVQISHCGAGTFEFRKHLKYVHELQHALRLCGIDKEIVL